MQLLLKIKKETEANKKYDLISASFVAETRHTQVRYASFMVRRMKKEITGILIFTLVVSCNIETSTKTMNDSTWRLGWRMIENSWNEKYTIAETQFDSLLNIEEEISEKFILTGLEIKSKLSKSEETLEILSNQTPEIQARFCKKEIAEEYEICKSQTTESVQNKNLQLKIIKLFVDDQAIRGNIMHDIIAKYDIDTTGIKTEQDWSNPDEISMDEINRNQLKQIFKEYGFPTKELIGRDAMRGIFLIIQHGDGDKEWQKLQLPKLELAAKKGDLSKQDYAYLFDRIKVNEGALQRYGSQFETVNREKGIAKLRETEDLNNLDKRRREMGMMPIETYRRLMLKK